MCKFWIFFFFHSYLTLAVDPSKFVGFRNNMGVYGSRAKAAGVDFSLRFMALSQRWWRPPSANHVAAFRTAKQNLMDGGNTAIFATTIILFVYRVFMNEEKNLYISSLYDIYSLWNILEITKRRIIMRWFIELLSTSILKPPECGRA